MCRSAMLTTTGMSCRVGRMSRRLATAMANRTTVAMAARNADSQNGEMSASSTLLIGQVRPQPSTASARPAMPWAVVTEGIRESLRSRNRMTFLRASTRAQIDCQHAENDRCEPQADLRRELLAQHDHA